MADPNARLAASERTPHIFTIVLSDGRAGARKQKTPVTATFKPSNFAEFVDSVHRLADYTSTKHEHIQELRLAVVERSMDYSIHVRAEADDVRAEIEALMVAKTDLVLTSMHPLIEQTRFAGINTRDAGSTAGNAGGGGIYQIGNSILKVYSAFSRAALVQELAMYGILAKSVDPQLFNVICRVEHVAVPRRVCRTSVLFKPLVCHVLTPAISTDNSPQLVEAVGLLARTDGRITVANIANAGVHVVVAVDTITDGVLAAAILGEEIYAPAWAATMTEPFRAFVRECFPFFGATTAYPSTGREPRARTGALDRSAAPAVDPALFINDEYFCGMVLFSRALGTPLQNIGRLNARRRRRILVNIAGAMRLIHRAHVAHCDFHSGQVIVDPVDDSVKILDFDRSVFAPWDPKADRFTLTAAAQSWGPDFEQIAPEQKAGRCAGFPSDVYAFGAMIFRVCTDHADLTNVSMLQPTNTIEEGEAVLLSARAHPARSVCRLIAACRVLEPLARPSMDEIEQELVRIPEDDFASAPQS